MKRIPQNGRVAIKHIEGDSRKITYTRARIGAKAVLTMEPLLDFPRKPLGGWCDDWMLIGYQFDGDPWIWLDSKNGGNPRPPRKPLVSKDTREEFECNSCGEKWIHTGDHVCPFCGSDDTGPADEIKEGTS